MKTLNFNTVKRPSWDVVLMDEKQTRLSLMMPEKGTIDRLVEINGCMQEIYEKDATDTSALQPIYELCAELLSCNKQEITVTAEEVQTKYRMTLEDVVLLLSGFTEFMAEVRGAKN